LAQAVVSLKFRRDQVTRGISGLTMLMRALLLACGLAPVALLLHGCGGGSPTPAPTPKPAPTPPPTPAPPFVPNYGASIKAVSYNLFWWCVSGNMENRPENHRENCARYRNGVGFKELYAKINAQAPFDLIGFQELIDINKIMNGIGLADKFESFAAPPQSPGVNDAGFAWSKTKFTKLGEPSAAKVCTDQYGARWMTYVRLKVTGTDSTILFCNTHGPLTHCDNAAGKKLAKGYMDAIEANRQPGDNVVLTGDFNCLPAQESMKLLMKNFTTVHDKTMTYDNIVRSNWVRLDKMYTAYAPPSDHSILTATMSLPDWGGKPARSDPPPAAAPPSPPHEDASLSA